MKNKVYRVVSITLWLSVIAVIFYLSQQDGTKSGESSGLVMRLLESLFNREFDEGIVREGAHFTEYLVLGVLTVNFGYAYRRYLQPFMSLLFGALYALSDEIHRYLFPAALASFSTSPWIPPAFYAAYCCLRSARQRLYRKRKGEKRHAEFFGLYRDDFQGIAF